MNRFFTLMVCSVLIFSTNISTASACEKWKSEIAITVFDLGSYILKYNEYINNKINKSTFINKANEITSKLQKIKDRVEAVSSCSSDAKYERRRTILLSVLTYAIPIIKLGNYLMPEKRDELKSHEE